MCDIAIKVNTDTAILHYSKYIDWSILSCYFEIISSFSTTKHEYRNDENKSMWKILIPEFTKINPRKINLHRNWSPEGIILFNLKPWLWFDCLDSSVLMFLPNFKWVDFNFINIFFYQYVKEILVTLFKSIIHKTFQINTCKTLNTLICNLLQILSFWKEDAVSRQLQLRHIIFCTDNSSLFWSHD